MKYKASTLLSHPTPHIDIIKRELALRLISELSIEELERIIHYEEKTSPYHTSRELEATFVIPNNNPYNIT